MRVRERATIQRVAFLRLRVSDAAAACDFLVSALPSPAPASRLLGGKAETVANMSETGSQAWSGPCLEARLIDRDRTAPDVLPAHADNVGATLGREQQQRKREPSPRPGRVCPLEDCNVCLLPDPKAVAGNAELFQAG